MPALCALRFAEAGVTPSPARCSSELLVAVPGRLEESAAASFGSAGGLRSGGKRERALLL